MLEQAVVNKRDSIIGLCSILYLDPKEPTILGFLVVISLCESLKR